MSVGAMHNTFKTSPILLVKNQNLSVFLVSPVVPLRIHRRGADAMKQFAVPCLGLSGAAWQRVGAPNDGQRQRGVGVGLRALSVLDRVAARTVRVAQTQKAGKVNGLPGRVEHIRCFRRRD